MDKLDRLKTLTDSMQTSLDEVAELTRKLQEAKSHQDRLQKELLPEAMREAGQTLLRLDDGRLIELTNKVVARIPAEAQEEAYAFLEDLGEGGMIKRTITCEFRKDQEEDTREALEALRHAGFHQARVAKNHHWKTFQAWVETRLKDGADLPMELFGIHELETVEIKKGKTK
jgi:glutaredoxin-related protein